MTQDTFSESTNIRVVSDVSKRICLDKLSLLYVACASIALCGCQNVGYQGFGVGPLVAPDQNNSGMDVVKVLREGLTSSKNNKSALVRDICFAPADNNKYDDTCVTDRNRAIAALRIASDDLCQNHIRGIYRNETAANMIAGTGATLASGWATVAGAVSAKSTLAAISTFFNAERSLINEVYFKEQVSTAVTAKIREARTEKAKQLDSRYSDDINKYPLLQALSDVISYHYTCSFVYGLEKALAEGHTSSNEIRRSKLEQERQQLQNTLDIHKVKGLDNAETDKGIVNRIKAIDDELLRLSTESPQKYEPKSEPNIGPQASGQSEAPPKKQGRLE